MKNQNIQKKNCSFNFDKKNNNFFANDLKYEEKEFLLIKKKINQNKKGINFFDLYSKEYGFKEYYDKMDVFKKIAS